MVLAPPDPDCKICKGKGYEPTLYGDDVPDACICRQVDLEAEELPWEK